METKIWKLLDDSTAIRDSFFPMISVSEKLWSVIDNPYTLVSVYHGISDEANCSVGEMDIAYTETHWREQTQP